MQYRKRPGIVEAIRFRGDNISDVQAWARAHSNCWPDGWTFAGSGKPHERIILIPTLEGTMTAMAGDFIIQGIEGEFYPCKPGIFAKNYEPLFAAP